MHDARRAPVDHAKNARAREATLREFRSGPGDDIASATAWSASPAAHVDSAQRRAEGALRRGQSSCGYQTAAKMILAIRQREAVKCGTESFGQDALNPALKS
jgi:hypothetical protein